MKVYYDLHIHSKLSACANELQTPNNILNMCMLKQLDMISITDHNSLKQYESIDRLKENYDFSIIYGVEVTVNEGFHVLGYFENSQDAYSFDLFLEDQIDHKIMNDESIGEQIVFDDYDLETQKIFYKLNQNTIANFNKVCEEIRRRNGLIVLAHIDRYNTSILSKYSDLYKFDFDAIEISSDGVNNNYLKKCDKFCKYKKLYNSDAHSIEMINERINYLDLEEKTFLGLKKWLKS